MGSSPVPGNSPSPDCQSDSPSPVLPAHSLPCWATQAQCDLAQAEAELRQLQERHATETESVKRGIERAVLGARREERRLLERVEQDHRDMQQHLEQVQRENLAAARVSQALLDQRLRKLAQLKQQIQEAGQQSAQDALNHNLLLKEVTDLLQPWEISVSLKKVNFKPSSQPNAVTFGDIRVQEQSLSLHGGGCGPQGRMCALHSHDNHQDAAGESSTIGQSCASPTGRVVRKISLSARSDLDMEEEQKLSSAKICHWLPKCEQAEWESCPDEMDSALFQPQGEDILLAVPTIHKNMDTVGKEHKMSHTAKPYSPRNQRKSFNVVTGRRLSPSPERRQLHCLNLDILKEHKGSQASNSRHLRYHNNVLTYPRMTHREPLVSQSCLDLYSRGRPHSCLSQSSDEHSLGTLGDSGRAPSPTDSLDSSYTFIVSESNNYSTNRGPLNFNCRRSKSSVDLTHKTHPLIVGGTNEHVGAWRGKYRNSSSMSGSTAASLTLSRGPGFSNSRGGDVLHQPKPEIPVTGSKQSWVARSLSMSLIDGSSQEPRRGRGERGEPALGELEEEGDPTVFNTRGVQLIRQFGKQGSGRADLTLPSGLHATAQGQLFIVDCGNARVQVWALFIVRETHAHEAASNPRSYD